MARIVMGLGSSHTPQLSSPVELWSDHASRDRAKTDLLGLDGESYTFDELADKSTRDLTSELLPSAWAAKHARAQQAIAQLGENLASSGADVVVIVGDDQQEMFLDDGTPTLAIYAGESIWDLPVPEKKLAGMYEGVRAAQWAFHGVEPVSYEVPAALGDHITLEMMTEEFDVLHLTRQPEGRSLGHAFTFVRRRIMGDLNLPILPVMVNTYVRPNQPTSQRCYAFGQALARAISSYPEDLKVAIVASGGLSHFVIDEQLDDKLITILRNRDREGLAEIPNKFYRSGTSESLNWIVVGGACEALSMETIDYIPAYRSEAGTGTGMAFARWT